MARQRPLLLLMKGHPGCGKSTLARHIAQLLAAPLVDKDDARNCFQPYCLSDKESEVDWNHLSYDVMFAVATTQLSLCLNVVVDCPLARVSLYQQAEKLAEQYGAALVVVECVCSREEVWRSRLESRAAGDVGTERGHKPGGWQQLQAMLSRYEGCWLWSSDGSTHIPCHITIDTAADTPAEEQARWVVSQVRQSPNVGNGAAVMQQQLR
mmetsp:Transcript_16133/g.34917  ORF Transcript_16133/g.34917 Transcript_16133/m.34917 type:complete len:210 (-) Transcript_16133:468-1097(-)